MQTTPFMNSLVVILNRCLRIRPLIFCCYLFFLGSSVTTLAFDESTENLTTYPDYEIGTPIPEGLQQPLTHYNHRVLSHEIAREVRTLLTEELGSDSNRADKVTVAVREAIVTQFEQSYLEYEIAAVMRRRNDDADLQRVAVQAIARRAQALTELGVKQALKRFGQLGVGSKHDQNKQIIDRAGATIKQRLLTLLDVTEIPGESSKLLGRKYPVYEQGDPLPKGAYKPLLGYTHDDLITLAVDSIELPINQFLSGDFPVKPHKQTTHTLAAMKRIMKERFEKVYMEYFISRTMLQKYASKQERDEDIKIIANSAARMNKISFSQALRETKILSIRMPSQFTVDMQYAMIDAIQEHILLLQAEPLSERSRMSE